MTLRHDWSPAEVTQLFEQPFQRLLHQAQGVHFAHFNPDEIQISALMSIKTGRCPEDCHYCPQSAHHDTELASAPLASLEAVLAQAKAAQQAGATRFCMGAAWRSPKDQDLPQIRQMIASVKALGMETCMTLGMLKPSQAQALAEAG